MASGTALVRALMDRAGSSSQLVSLGALAGSLGLALVLALSGFELAAGILVVLSVVAEWLIESRSPAAADGLQQAAFGPPMRFAIRVILVLMAASVFGDVSALRVFVVVALIEVLALCVRALHTEYRRVGTLRPLRTRHVPGNPTIDPAPPEHPGVVIVSQLAVLTPGIAGAPWWLVLAVAVAGIGLVAAYTIPDGRVSLRMRAAKRARGMTPQLQQIQEFIDDYAPEVLVHVSGPASAAYQINMWLEALEALDQRVLIIIRDEPLFRRMRSSPIPTLSLPSAGDLLMLDIPSARIALFPSNTGNNIHLLRLPQVMSAFIGHGDSDKSASNNPFSRAYDELWVAGEAGADRYRKSGLGIHEDQFRFVGRPQAHAIEPRREEAPEIPTVLYAPTWEGVNHKQEYSSLSAIGPDLIQALLDTNRIRVVYKPHPFTGQRDAKFRGTHARITAAITKARTSSGLDHRVVTSGAIIPWFNQSDALVSDISSVLSDYLASEKPYAVFNHTGRWVPKFSTREFREAFPSSAAATVIAPDGQGIDEFVQVVLGEAEDTLAAYRSRLATYLVGEPEHRSIDYFKSAIDAFVERSETERARYRSASAGVASPGDDSDPDTLSE
jgi:hypothetical protein